MRRKLLGVALAGFLTLGVAGGAAAATLSYTGTLTFQISTLPALTAAGGGTALVNGTAGGIHLSSLVISAGDLGPVTASLPVTSNYTINSVIFTAVGNLSGSLAGLSAAPGGGPMGLSGTAKICLAFGPCAFIDVPVPLSPVTGVGIGVGGTQTVPGAVALTMQHNPWTIGDTLMTIHNADTNVTTPTLPSGFVHAPGTGGASSAVQDSGVLQLVTATKAYTSLTGAFPELPIFSILNLHFFSAAPPVTEVDIDIKPGSDPNSINLKSMGVIPVAILTTEDFDASTVDADSVRFGPAEAEKRHKRAHVVDVDGDGDLDLMLHFRTQETGIAPGDTEACVTGQTYDGVPVEGCDSVRTVPPN